MSLTALFQDSSVLELEQVLLRIALSGLAGFLLGLERQIHRQPAGLKTHILICTGSTLLMITSLILSGGLSILNGTKTPLGDPARLAAQVVSGIGFLGGGAIIRQGFNIKGLTTAATIWVSAAIGLAIGIGAFFPAAITLFIVLGTLTVMERFESTLMPPKTIKTLVLLYQEKNMDYKALEKELAKIRILVGDMDIARTMDSDKVKVLLHVHIPEHVEIPVLTATLQKAGKLLKMELTSNDRSIR